MDRILELELMEDENQVKAYAEADFEEPHSCFINCLKQVIGGQAFQGLALDLGCGPGDIDRRFAEAYPQSQLHAVDGSAAMINYALSSLAKPLQNRVHFILGQLPHAILPNSRYDVIFSNSLLHHLADPSVLWEVIKQYSHPGTCVAIMDLVRPNSPGAAQELVRTYASNEPLILQKDFYNSLLAAFSLEEIYQQLDEANLNLNIKKVSDRHIFISGLML